MGRKAENGRAGKKDSVGAPGAKLEADSREMTALVAFTARSLETESPRPFGASIVDSKTGKPLLRALNAVAQEIDPSSHAEVRAIRKATRKGCNGLAAEGPDWCLTRYN